MRERQAGAQRVLMLAEFSKRAARRSEIVSNRIAWDHACLGPFSDSAKMGRLSLNPSLEVPSHIYGTLNPEPDPGP